MLPSSHDDVWVIVGAAVLLVALVAAVTLAALLLYRRYIRLKLVALIGYRERIRASKQTLETILRNLADDSDEALVAFASDGNNETRKALAEIANRMSMTRDELDVKRMPSVFLPATIELADYAYTIADVAEWLHSGVSEDDMLQRMGAVNLNLVVQQADIADSMLHALCDRFDIEDAVVYGGGLYL